MSPFYALLLAVLFVVVVGAGLAFTGHLVVKLGKGRTR